MEEGVGSHAPFNHPSSSTSEQPTTFSIPDLGLPYIMEQESSDDLDIEEDIDILGFESSDDGSHSGFENSDAEFDELLEGDANADVITEEPIIVEDTQQGGTSAENQITVLESSDNIEDFEAHSLEEELDDELSDELSDASDLGRNQELTKVKRYRVFNEQTGFVKPICLKKSMLFSSNVVFRQAVKQFSIESGGDYYYLHNDKKKVYAYCSNACSCALKHGRKTCACGTAFCEWKVLGRKFAPDGTFQLKSIIPKHTCGWQMKHTKLNSPWLARQYLEHYRADPKWNLAAFIDRVLKEHSIEITYKQAWRGRYRAILSIQGDTTTQYGKVWDYAATVTHTNPGSRAIVKVDNLYPEKPLFLRMYVCLAPCRLGFLKGCRDILCLDGCHLRGAYSGQLLSAVGRDGNNNIFPVAYAVVEAERKETWMWFMELLDMDVAGAVPCFMSDRQKGLREAVKKYATYDSRQRVCVRHMYENFKLRIGTGKGYKDLIWKAARAYTVTEFNSSMDAIKAMNVEAYEYLMEKTQCFGRGIHLTRS